MVNAMEATDNSSVCLRHFTLLVLVRYNFTSHHFSCKSVLHHQVRFILDNQSNITIRV